MRNKEKDEAEKAIKRKHAMETAFRLFAEERGMRDGTIRNDLSEEVMFSGTFHIMLAAVTRYAVGLVYEGTDHEQELLILKDSLLHEFHRG